MTCNIMFIIGVSLALIKITCMKLEISSNFSCSCCSYCLCSSSGCFLVTSRILAAFLYFLPYYQQDKNTFSVPGFHFFSVNVAVLADYASLSVLATVAMLTIF